MGYNGQNGLSYPSMKSGSVPDCAEMPFLLPQVRVWGSSALIGLY